MVVKTKKYFLPIILVATPYLYFRLLFGAISKQNKMELLFFAIAYLAIMLLIYLPNCIYAFLLQKKILPQSAVCLNMVVKLCLVPFYLEIFFLGTLVVGLVFLFGGFFVGIILWLVDLSILLPTSLYGVAALNSAHKAGLITRKQQIVHSILHCFFCLDVISAIIVFFKVRKAAKIKDNTQSISQNIESEIQN